MKSWLALVLVLTALLMAAERPVYAYVDPGSASYIFQILIGSLVGGVFFVRMFWARLKESVRERFARPRGR